MAPTRRYGTTAWVTGSGRPLVEIIEDWSAPRYRSAMASKADLRRRLDDLSTFHRLLGALLEVSTVEPTGWSNKLRVTPKHGQESEWFSAKAGVDRHAARAVRAFDEAGAHMRWSPPGTMNQYPLNPASQWATICEEDPIFGIDALDTCINQALGALESRIDDPLKGERGPATIDLHPVTRVAWKVATWLVGGLALAWLAWKLGWS